MYIVYVLDKDGSIRLELRASWGICGFASVKDAQDCIDMHHTRYPDDIYVIRVSDYQPVKG